MKTKVFLFGYVSIGLTSLFAANAQAVVLRVSKSAHSQKDLVYPVTLKNDSVVYAKTKYIEQIDSTLIHVFENYDASGEISDSTYFIEEVPSDFFSSFNGEGTIDFSEGGYDHPIIVSNGKTTRLVGLMEDIVRGHASLTTNNRSGIYFIPVDGSGFDCNETHYLGTRDCRLSAYAVNDTVSVFCKTGTVVCTYKKSKVKRKNVIYIAEDKKFVVTSLGKQALKNNYSIFCYYDEDRKMIVLANGFALKEISNQTP